MHILILLSTFSTSLQLTNSQQTAEEYFPSPFLQHRASIENFQPFKVYFVFQKNFNSQQLHKLGQARDYVNLKLGKLLRGPILDEIRFERQFDSKTSSCSKPMCADATIPGEYALPCLDAQKKLIAEIDVPTTPSTELQLINKSNYSLVVYIAMHGPDAPDFNCAHFVKKNQQAPECRWYGPPVMGVPCQIDTHQRVTHARLSFCKPIDKFEVDQGELRMILLHEILHFVIGNMDINGGKQITRPWHDENGTAKNETFFVVTTPQVQEAVRNYFQCPRLEGAEVPVRIFVKNGTLQPKWDHWSFRLFPDEILTPHTSYEEKLSKLTLGAIADRGWYEADLSQAEILPRWDSSMNGCDLATKSCYQLIQDARKKSDALHDIWPICDHRANISSRCSPDGRQRMLCHQIEDYSCYALHTVACLGHHPLCEKATRQSYLFPTIGLPLRKKRICVTFASFPGIEPKTLSSEHSLPPCVERECRLNDRSIILRFNPKNSDSCEFICTQDKANKLVEYIPSDKCKSALALASNSNQKFLLICPEYYAVCGGSKSDDLKTNIANRIHLANMHVAKVVTIFLYTVGFLHIAQSCAIA